MRWNDEPIPFSLEWKNDGPAEMMTPDSYLPDLNLYPELTTVIFTGSWRTVRWQGRTFLGSPESYPERQIGHKVKELGKILSTDYTDKRPIAIGVQRGMVYFMADLIRYISLPIRMDSMSISHYSGERGPSIKITKFLDIDS